MLICSAAVEKAGPFNSDALSRALGKLASHDRTGDTSSWLQSREVRSPTSSPPPEGNHRFEAFCHDELVKAGGRPVASFGIFLDTLKDAKASKKMLVPWLGDTDSGYQNDTIPSVFSTQLEDWESFQHKWQWDNRGKYAGDEGFAAFLESRRRRCLHKGELQVVSDPSFEATARHIWDYEQRYLELSGREGFAAYTQAVKKRLASHYFTQPLQLVKDPSQQDARTTWVEYLSYVYWWRDRYAAAMEAAKPQYQKAWDELLLLDTSLLSTTSATTGVLDEELGATRAQLEGTRQKIRRFVKNTKTYRQWETAVHRQELRAQWVFEQLPSIEITSSTEQKATKNSPSAKNGKKRKARDNHDALTHQQPKRRRQRVGHSSSTLDPEPGIGERPDIAMPDKTAATSTTASSRPRRSQRLRASLAAGGSHFPTSV